MDLSPTGAAEAPFTAAAAERFMAVREEVLAAEAEAAAGSFDNYFLFE